MNNRNNRNNSNNRNRNNKNEKNTFKHRINQHIRVPNVRLIYEDVNEVVSREEALKIAEDAGLDLVEIVPNANPPVCKIIDYEKFLYQLKKQEKDQKKLEKEKRQNIKEIKLSPNIGEHDLEFKRKHAQKFLEDNDIVKCTLRFKGRGIVFKDQGMKVLLEFAQSLLDFGMILKMPELNGKLMTMTIKPKK